MAMNILGEQINDDGPPRGALPLDYATSIVHKRDWRSFRIATQHVLTVSALVLFAWALTEPALYDHPLWGGAAEPTFGAVCLLWGIFWYPSNAWLLLSPIIAANCRRARSRTNQIVMLILSALSLAAVLFVPLSTPGRDMLIGCYLWVAAHCCVLLVYLIPVWKDYDAPKLPPKRGTWPPEPKHRRGDSSTGF
jgi:hypothetical protein